MSWCPPGADTDGPDYEGYAQNQGDEQVAAAASLLHEAMIHLKAADEIRLNPEVVPAMSWIELALKVLGWEEKPQ